MNILRKISTRTHKRAGTKHSREVGSEWWNKKRAEDAARVSAETSTERITFTATSRVVARESLHNEVGDEEEEEDQEEEERVRHNNNNTAGDQGARKGRHPAQLTMDG